MWCNWCTAMYTMQLQCDVIDVLRCIQCSWPVKHATSRLYSRSQASAAETLLITAFHIFSSLMHTDHCTLHSNHVSILVRTHLSFFLVLSPPKEALFSFLSSSRSSPSHGINVAESQYSRAIKISRRVLRGGGSVLGLRGALDRLWACSVSTDKGAQLQRETLS